MRRDSRTSEENVQLRELSAKRPYLLSLFIILTFSVVNVVSSGLQTTLPELPQPMMELVAEVVLAILAVFC